jgi:pyochelin synthetase
MSEAPVRGPDDQSSPFPLTEIQYAYWVGRGPNFVLGNVCPHAYFELEGRRLDVDLLSRAWHRLLRRHPMLRAVVDADGAQVVLPDVPFTPIACVDVSALPADEAEAVLSATRDEMSHRVYDAGTWPLHDIRVSRLAAHDRLHISLDLLMVDLASIALLFSEWRELCLHPERELPPRDVTFRDYVLALEAQKDSPRTLQALDYWRSRATTLAPPPDLPLDRSPVSVHHPEFSHREFHLPPDDWKLLQDRAQQRGLTPTAVLATAFAAVLATWSGTERFTMNLTLFNRLPLLHEDDGAGHRRLHPHLQGVVGDFTSICLLEVDTGGDDPFGERVDRLQLQLQRDLRHRHVSALHALRERRRLGLQNGFETVPVVFTSGLGTVADVTGPKEYFGDITYRISQTPQVWLDHQVVDFTGSLDLTWDAVEELFPAGVLDDMFAAYTELVGELARGDAAWERTPEVLPPGRQLRTRAAANDTAGHRPDGLLHEAFHRRAATDPDRAAVITSSGIVDYGDLAAQARAVAAAVQAVTSPPTDRLVGVALPKGADQVAAAHGVVLAGAAYLPIAPALPRLRRERIIEDGRVELVLADDGVSWPDGLTVCDPARLLTASPERSSTGPGDIAYVIFTSGSTGTPKGVVIEHHAALNTVVDITERFGITEDDRVFGLAELGFDLSVYDVFGALGAGAALVLPDQDKLAEPAHWAELMRAHGVTVWNSVPAQMQMLVEHLEAGAEIPPGLRVVMLSGDWIPVDLPERITALWPEARVISLGGATEASIWSIWHEADRIPEGATSVPYGTPLRNQTFHVLDRALRPCPEWVSGELYIGGVGLARGYWADEAKTAASFLRHPETGERLYRTGDHGRYLPDGTIQFLGRRDGQVKIGGHRIELGEVEAVLSRHPGVDRAVAVKSADDASPRVLAFVTPAKGDALTVTEEADPAASARRWAAVSTADDLPGGPEGAGQTAAWSTVDDLHAVAAAVALRAIGLPHRVGEVFTADAAVRSHGVADRYARWVDRAVAALADRGWLAVDPTGVRVLRELPEEVPAGVAGAARRALCGELGVPEDLADWLIRLAGQLKGLLVQDVHSAELYTSDRTPEVYQRLFGATYEVAATAVRRLVDDLGEDEPLRVLEVGAGYGSLTERLLPLLPADRTSYLFTDISGYFLDRAREEFAGYHFLVPALFDIDSPAQTQGGDLPADPTVDLLVAASVLHDAKRIAPTLRSLRSLLAPGGLLLVVEQTRFHPWFDLTMGLQQGFDGFADTELRTAHPLLDRAGWAEQLADAGFTGSAVLTAAGGPAAMGFDVIVARAPDVRHRYDTGPLLDHVAESLPAYMVPAALRVLDALPLSATGKVDRGALAKATGRSGARGRAAKPPRTDRQRKLVELWRGVLGLAHADLTDDFLESGGDSLLAARLVAGVRSAFGVDVSVAVVLQRSTVEALDAHLEHILGPSDPLEAS